MGLWKEVLITQWGAGVWRWWSGEQGWLGPSRGFKLPIQGVARSQISPGVLQAKYPFQVGDRQYMLLRLDMGRVSKSVPFTP